MSQTREIAFDQNAVSLDTVKKAAYRFIDQFSTEFLIEGSIIKAILRFSACKSDDSADSLVEDFRKEVLDQDLRASIKAETEAVRNLILAHAFSKTALIKDG